MNIYTHIKYLYTFICYCIRWFKEKNFEFGKNTKIKQCIERIPEKVRVVIKRRKKEIQIILICMHTFIIDKRIK